MVNALVGQVVGIFLTIAFLIFFLKSFTLGGSVLGFSGSGSSTSSNAGTPGARKESEKISDEEGAIDEKELKIEYKLRRILNDINSKLKKFTRTGAKAKVMPKPSEDDLKFIGQRIGFVIENIKILNSLARHEIKDEADVKRIVKKDSKLWEMIMREKNVLMHLNNSVIQLSKVLAGKDYDAAQEITENSIKFVRVLERMNKKELRLL